VSSTEGPQQLARFCACIDVSHVCSGCVSCPRDDLYAFQMCLACERYLRAELYHKFSTLLNLVTLRYVKSTKAWDFLTQNINLICIQIR